ncbi:MAG: cytochrome c family protein [Myxococcota bacterium]|jgi:hypothetical protein|nr:cytochrome c family protein [Myxococcota bacterium]
MQTRKVIMRTRSMCCPNLFLATLLSLTGLGCTRTEGIEKVVVKEVPAPCPPCPANGGTAEENAADTAAPNATDGPEISMLFHLLDRYEPVRFTHANHVSYASACAFCHHHGTQVDQTPACRECHGRSDGGLARVGLKGAYHRQCMDCHRRMGSGPMGCEDCHALRKTRATATESTQATKKFSPEHSTLGHLSKIYEPAKFNHRLHESFKETCAGCHHHNSPFQQAPPCRECHNTRATAAGEKRLGLEDAYHGQCMTCHKEMGAPQGCEDCHAKKNAVPLAPSK